MVCFNNNLNICLLNESAKKNRKENRNILSLDLYFLLTARLNNYKIIERPLVIYKRVAGEAKGGGTLFTKIKLTLRTLNYVYNLKKRKKF